MPPEMANLVAFRWQPNDMGISSDISACHFHTPNRVHPQSGYAVGGISISTIDIEELRRKANGTSMPGVSQGDRIRLRPVGTTWLPDEPDRPGNLDTTPNRAFDKACTRAPGKKPAVSLLPRILRASRRSGAWVSIAGCLDEDWQTVRL